MFSKNNKKSTESDPRRATNRTGAPSIISADLRIIGDIFSDGDIQIEGIVEGDVRTRAIVVGDHALVKGTIHCDEARIRGSVEGAIFARSVQLAQNSRVSGDVVHEQLAIDAGAYIDGRCKRVDDINEGGTPEIKAIEGPKGGSASSDSTGSSASSSDSDDADDLTPRTLSPGGSRAANG